MDQSEPAPALSAQQLLDAISGPAYLVDADGRILLIGQQHWNAHVGGASVQPDPGALVGRNLFEFIAGGPVQAVYRRILARLREHPAHPWQLNYRCDSPGVLRELRMTVSAVPGAQPVYLFSSQVLREEQRPPMSIFDQERRSGSAPDATAPILLICSLCNRVKGRTGDDCDPSNWIEPELYYRDGGSPHVSLSHGLCPGCYADIMALERQTSG